MIQLDRHTYHVIICLVTLSLGCEWKPPRRAQSMQKKMLQAVNKENAEKHPASTSNMTLQPKVDATVTQQKTQPMINQTVQYSSVQTPIIKEVKNAEVETAEVKTPEAKTAEVKSAQGKTPEAKTVNLKGERIQQASPVRLAQRSTEVTNIKSITTEEIDYLHTIEQDAPPELYLKSLQIGTSIKQRRLLGKSKRFDAREKQLKAYLIVRNFDTPQHIIVRWFNENKPIKKNRLKIGVSPRWRTWTTLRRPAQFGTGSWKVEVYSKTRKLLARTSFYIESHE